MDLTLKNDKNSNSKIKKSGLYNLEFIIALPKNERPWKVIPFDLDGFLRNAWVISLASFLKFLASLLKSQTQ